MVYRVTARETREPSKKADGGRTEKAVSMKLKFGSC